ncbi:MAG TPA: polyphosphate kinase 2 family protein [Actinocrinis sp.]|nr:polyphosphate kinase 2 family protein [Actinocrinis sp.]
MAKSGGKGDGKRRAEAKQKKSDVADKRADKKKDKSSGKAETVAIAGVAHVGAGESARSNGSTKLKSVKFKRGEGNQRLVEQVAAEIVIAELDRAAESDSVTVGFPQIAPQSIEKLKAAGKKAAEKKAPGEKAVEKKVAGKKADKKAAEKNAAEEKAAEKDVKQEADTEAVVFSELLRVPVGPVDLAAIDPGATPGVSSRDQAEDELPKLAARLEELQERLFAAARGGDSNRKVLLVLQGMDTSGKGGTVRHVIGQLDPNGTRLTAFKAPTEEERAHDFLWRIRRALPAAGEVGIFDRSHYEDVLIARVRKLAAPMIIGRRYQLINGFEKKLVADGAVLVKCFLHISRDEQKERLLARLDNPAKHWKYNPGDVDERELWPQYQDAYRIALEKCSTPDAPWYVVPADHKWYRNYAVTRLLVEALERIDPEYPAGDFDLEAERARVLAS